MYTKTTCIKSSKNEERTERVQVQNLNSMNRQQMSWWCYCRAHLANCAFDQMHSAFDQMCAFNQLAYMHDISSR